MTAALHGLSHRRGLSNSDEWRTPDRLFHACSHHYGPFDVDAFAARWNAWCPKYFTKRNSALKKRWRGRVWANPPYSRGNLMKCVSYARDQVRAGCELVCDLVPAYTSERWWQQHVMGWAMPFGPRSEVIERDGIGRGFRMWWPKFSIEVQFVDGRLRFRHESGVQDSARHPSAVVVFSR